MFGYLIFLFSWQGRQAATGEPVLGPHRGPPGFHAVPQHLPPLVPSLVLLRSPRLPQLRLEAEGREEAREDEKGSREGPRGREEKVLPASAHGQGPRRQVQSLI